jgi:Protein of unknown function (DUF3987)/Primase C terminal 2 (PriCT-2)
MNGGQNETPARVVAQPGQDDRFATAAGTGKKTQGTARAKRAGLITEHAKLNSITAIKPRQLSKGCSLGAGGDLQKSPGGNLVQGNVAVMADHFRLLAEPNEAAGDAGMLEIVGFRAQRGAPVSPRHDSALKAVAQEAAERAAKMNAVDGVGVYVGAGLRRPDIPRDARASDNDVKLMRWLWLDLDDDGAAEQAEVALGAVSFLPHLEVTTGRTPHLRRQFWWRLAKPCAPDQARDLMRGLAAALGADPSPVNPSRVMRLAGSIAWPKSHKPGRIAELVTLDAARDGAVTLAEVEAAAARLMPQPPKPMPSASQALLDDDAGRVGQMLRETPNTLDRESWVRLAFALKGALGDAPRADFLDFSARWPDAQAGEAGRLWNTAKPDGRSGLGTAFELLRQSGGKIPIARDPSEWPTPDLSLLQPDRAAPPAWPGASVFSTSWAEWIAQAAEAKGAPPDYVGAAVLSAASSLIGNACWPSPRDGWKEPPVLWCIIIGQPSAGKSPGLDAALDPLREVERRARGAMLFEIDAWKVQSEADELGLSVWRDQVKKATKANKEPPERPPSDLPPEPIASRLIINDMTTERAAVILERQPRGALQVRDELAGWLNNMERYAAGGSDRQFWLEAYGGRSWTVERMGRDPVHVPRMALGVLGGIQPDKLTTLLMRGVDDDGLLARFMPIWPDPAPITRPRVGVNDAFAEIAFERLLSLPMMQDDGDKRPALLPFDDAAQGILHTWRLQCRDWEGEVEGLLLSYLGKLPGVAVRLSAVLALLDWAEAPGNPRPERIGAAHLTRACHFIEAYVLPMARRAYADASVPAAEQGARRVLDLVLREHLESVNVREIQRRKLTGLREAAAIKAALGVLVEADVLREEQAPTAGRTATRWRVNPRLWGGA